MLLSLPLCQRQATGCSSKSQRDTARGAGTGSDAVNGPLARDRADAVRNPQLARRVSTARVGAQGRGARQAVAGNDTEAGRAANRRLEISLSDEAA